MKTPLKFNFPLKCELTPTNLGLTNDIYKGSIDSDQVAVRIPKEETKMLSTFDNEKNVLPLIKDLDLDVPELYFDPDTRIRITRWISNAQEYKDCLDEDKIERVAHLLKKLHHAHLNTGVNFDCEAHFKEYQSHIRIPLYPLENYAAVLDELKKITNPKTLCHNDLVSGNLLFTDKRDYLIDYEYARDNDPLFDVMSFFTENKITEPSLRKRFYAAYFDEPCTSLQLQQLHTYECFHNLLWCAWANMMYDLLSEQVYFDIAKDKYEALLACTKSWEL